MPAALRWNSYQNNLLILDICDLMYLLSRNSRKLDLSLNKQGKKIQESFSAIHISCPDISGVLVSFPGGSDGKESACNTGDPGSGRSPGRE